ncbi:MAG: 3-dehydroquinate synthase [Pseudomonadales bacterium]|jgi:3-dehydroquinate synthase
MDEVVMQSVNVELGQRSYPIYIGAGLLGQADLLRRHIAGNQVAIVSNEVVAPLYLDLVTRSLDGLPVDVFTLPDGEQHKNLDRYKELLDFLISKRHNRSTTLIALGGGVVGDLTGFAAATFQRGVSFIQIPTTLLAQVDSSVGGKTAVNHAAGKNLIGAFHQPRCVLADTSVLKSLGPREFQAGLAETLKYGIISDPTFFAWLEASANALMKRDDETLCEAIRRSCEIKADVVAQDETETGIRAILNFGHTFGHAIEALTNYRTYLHGEAVAIGMVMAADLSMRQGWLEISAAQRIKKAIAAFDLPVAPAPVKPEDMLRVMGMDKKVVDGTLRLVLSRGIGEVVVTQEIDLSALGETLAAVDGLCNG